MSKIADEKSLDERQVVALETIAERLGQIANAAMVIKTQLVANSGKR